ncbi:MAG: 2-keto-4-pentenoate hydratase [Spirochaetales bacterium]|jgi:2-keto-4-pentenoate hydratase|nr:2-keto-4-pentenoate hydratase [Spirochaetales bacterium]
MDEEKIRSFADELFEAEKNRTPVPPLTERCPSLSVDDAYRIQLVNVQRLSLAGCRISGKKIGLTSRGIQEQFGVHEPDYGHLFDFMDCKNGEVPAGALTQPKIEGEIAFVLKDSLSGGKVTADDVRRATDYVSAAFEVVDSRVMDWKIKLPDTIADNASSGRYTLGSARIRIRDVDLSSVTMKLFKNGNPAGEGSGAAVLGDPAGAVAWLANRLWDYRVQLKAGEIILSGAFFGAVSAARGDVFVAEYSSFGKVEARFV